MLQSSKSVKRCIKEEKKKFPDVIMNVQKMFEGPDDVRLKEILVNKDDIIIKLLQYMQYWKARRASKSTIIFLLKSICALISNVEEESRAKRQNYLD